MAYLSNDPMFRSLTDNEEQEFRTYAEQNYPDPEKYAIYHPVCKEVWWRKACEFDGVDPKEKFVVFSDDNPYA